MAKKFYVVWQGRKTGIFTDWNMCKQQVDAFAGAKYKSFKTKVEAEAAFNGQSSSRPSSSPYKRSESIKNPTKVKTYTEKEVLAVDVDVKLFTDGGCEPNPGKSGSGLAVYKNNEVCELWYGLYNPSGTNNTAELNALHQSMLMAKERLSEGVTVAIFCDSKYSIQCITQWAINWEKKGWKKSGGEIKNLSLIQKMFSLYQCISKDIQILHVNGHVGVEGNELADRMSILAIKAKQKAFVLYDKILDVDAILAMRVG